MRKLYVALSEAEIDVLRRVSLAERRHPADQAAVLLAGALKQALQTGKPTETHDRQPVETGAT